MVICCTPVKSEPPPNFTELVSRSIQYHKCFAYNDDRCFYSNAVYRMRMEKRRSDCKNKTETMAKYVFLPPLWFFFFQNIQNTIESNSFVIYVYIECAKPYNELVFIFNAVQMLKIVMKLKRPLRFMYRNTQYILYRIEFKTKTLSLSHSPKNQRQKSAHVHAANNVNTYKIPDTQLWAHR